MAIDGPSGILGQAGPTQLRPITFLPAAGIMSFDSADLAQMENDGSLVSVIVHEMGHVLGFGTIFGRVGLIEGAGGDDPRFTGAAATREYAALRGEGAAEEPVPIENRGGPGTRDGHWREETFANELMTGYINQGVNPISRLTIAAFEDLGYEVDYNFADPYRLPAELEVKRKRLPGEETGHDCVVLVPEATVLPETALV